MDSLTTEKTDEGTWEARYFGVDGIVGKGDTELEAVASLARALGNMVAMVRNVVC